MANCELEVVVDSVEGGYRSGDLVRGTVFAQVKNRTDCDELKVEVFWRAHGRGREDEGPHSEKVIFSGEWLGDRTHEHSFELEIPPGPPTFQGQVTIVDWIVRARADISWAIDPKAETRFRVHPPEPAAREPTAFSSDEPLTVPEGARQASATTVNALLILGGIGALVCGGVFVQTDSCAGVLCSVVPFGLAFFLLRPKILQWKLGDVTYEVSDTSPQPGDAVRCALRFTPRRPVELTAITASLVRLEYSVSDEATDGRGPHKHVHAETVQEVRLLEWGRVAAGEPVSGSAELRIPQDAPPSFTTQSHVVAWWVKLHVDVPRWPDLVKRIPIKVGDEPSHGAGPPPTTLS